jgi:hypothetical protein
VGERIAAHAATGDAPAPPRWSAMPTSIINLLDPNVIALDGGLSKQQHLYERMPQL